MYQRKVALYICRRSWRCWRVRRIFARRGYDVEVIDATNDGASALLMQLAEALHQEIVLPYVFIDTARWVALATSRPSTARVPSSSWCGARCRRQPEKLQANFRKVPDQDGLRLVLKAARERLPRLSHLWVDPGYQGRGKHWAEQELGLGFEVVHRTPKPIPEKIAKIWAEEWAKEGREINWQKLLPRRGFEILPRRWVVERTFAWLGQNRRMSKDYERLCATAEAFVYAAMSRLMVRRLARD